MTSKTSSHTVDLNILSAFWTLLISLIAMTLLLSGTKPNSNLQISVTVSFVVPLLFCYCYLSSSSSISTSFLHLLRLLLLLLLPVLAVFVICSCGRGSHRRCIGHSQLQNGHLRSASVSLMTLVLPLVLCPNFSLTFQSSSSRSC